MSKRVNKRKKALRNSRAEKSLIKRIFIILIIGLIGIGLIFALNTHAQKQIGTRILNISSGEKAISKLPKYTPLISPYPTVTVTPSPVPLTGFCLHVPILMYHHIQPEAIAKELGQTALTVDSGIFDQQMAYLAGNGYTPIWANELTNALVTHTQLPGKPIVITIDDGYADNYVYALPILQKYGIKANIALASGLMGGNPDMLTWDQVNQLKGSGLIYFLNHTWSHYAVSNGPQSKIDSEIDVAQGQIQSNTGQTVNIFVYPYGSINSNAIETLRRKGYASAISEIYGQYQCDSFIMTLHRTRIGNGSLASYGI